MFFTWTAPSRFHAWKTGRNGKTIETTSTRAPPARHLRLSGQAVEPDPRLLKRNELPVYGFSGMRASP